MEDYLHEGMNLKNSTKVWHCEDCGKDFKDDGSYQADICPYCGSGNTYHEHVVKQGLSEILNQK